jgi:hypothetical protein
MTSTEEARIGRGQPIEGEGHRVEVHVDPLRPGAPQPVSPPQRSDELLQGHRRRGRLLPPRVGAEGGEDDPPPAYIEQANREAVHAKQPFGVVVVKRVRANVSAAYHVRDAETDVRLINRLRDAETLLQHYAPGDIWKRHYERHGGGR